MDAASVVLLVGCGALLVLLHICATVRRRNAATLAQCREALERTRREAFQYVAGALRELDNRDHEQARQRRQTTGQRALRMAGAGVDAPVTPFADMEQDIRQSYRILIQLQDDCRLSGDPLERERLNEKIIRTRDDLMTMLRVYEEKTDALSEPMASDIGEIVILMGE